MTHIYVTNKNASTRPLKSVRLMPFMLNAPVTERPITERSGEDNRRKNGAPIFPLCAVTDGQCHLQPYLGRERSK
ncbi:hypothetical protein B224_p00022 (plasmid) [Aeromonas media WS]|nr:hypothetical protein B224_p00022 [Aeromonas media WS]